MASFFPGKLGGGQDAGDESDANECGLSCMSLRGRSGVPL